MIKINLYRTSTLEFQAFPLSRCPIGSSMCSQMFSRFGTTSPDDSKCRHPETSG